MSATLAAAIGIRRLAGSPKKGAAASITAYTNEVVRAPISYTDPFRRQGGWHSDGTSRIEQFSCLYFDSCFDSCASFPPCAGASRRGERSPSRRWVCGG